MVMSKESSPGEKCSTSEEAESMFTPRFKSVVAMAGWDEEALLIATLVVEDTPEQELTRQKKRPDLQFKTPPTNSRRKRRNQRKSPSSIPMVVLNLEEDEEETKKKDIEQNKVEQKVREKEENKTGEEVIQKKKTDEELVPKNSVVSCSSSGIPCMDKLREELSCAICLEICFEPSTTPCGHSFCKKCLRSAADKCGKKCPKCRQLVSNGRSCTVNTVLWNTIQLLFPQEIEARKTSDPSLNSCRKESQHGGFELVTNNDSQNRIVRPAASRVSSSSRDVRNRSVASQVRVSSRDGSIRVRRRTGISTQNEDAAMALRLQREEFMEAFRGSSEQTSSARALSLARENLRAMASRAADLRLSR